MALNRAPPLCSGPLDPMRQIAFIPLLLSLLSTTACVRRYRASPSALLHLTRAAHSEIAYKASTAPDEQLLQVVYSIDPEIRRDLGRFWIRTQRDGTRFVILVCLPNGKRGLLEDASWTPEVDRDWQKPGQKHPCSFDPAIDPRTPQAPSISK
jgi:hypothetical protein